ncbi:MAG: 7-cyano-7-deazaguanine synthase QueC [Deltaproteobacteria bacterium RBG_16_44_11]|nr:MAG: 7-cyano-7-deazaguanine synthase QueC [Deltaproteobacteria bacterium RBG_16_44_11]
MIKNKDLPDRKAVILLSGGIDSATTLAIAKNHGYEIYALSFRYGQRHQVELAAAMSIVRHFKVANHLTVDIDLRVIGGSALTSDIAVPKNRKMEKTEKNIPITYVPARNTIFLSYALAWAEVIGANDIFIGVNAMDYSGYPDCRPEYITAYEKMANLATKAAVSGKQKIIIHTPLIAMSKAQIIHKGVGLGVDYSLTHSCYDPTEQGEACGHCDSCLLRLKGFRDAGMNDPIPYRR